MRQCSFRMVEEAGRRLGVEELLVLEPAADLAGEVVQSGHQ